MVRQVVFTIFVLLLFTGILLGLWSSWKYDLLYSEKYRLDPRRFHLPESPPWIPETFVYEVLTAAKFGQKESVLDKKLPERLAAAFAANPWVHQFRKVLIQYPAEIYVDLDYRSPVCLVELPGGSGFYPVDAYGTLLPADYFTQGTREEIAEKMNPFPFVVGTPSNPIGSFGDSWGDSSVEKAARIAAMLGENAGVQGIVSIQILVAPKENLFTIQWEPEPPQFQLIAENGHVFDWGTFDFLPGNPQMPDPKEETRLENFRQWIKE